MFVWIVALLTSLFVVHDDKARAQKAKRFQFAGRSLERFKLGATAAATTFGRRLSLRTLLLPLFRGRGGGGGGTVGGAATLFRLGRGWALLLCRLVRKQWPGAGLTGAQWRGHSTREVLVLASVVALRVLHGCLVKVRHGELAGG